MSRPAALLVIGLAILVVPAAATAQEAVPPRAQADTLARRKAPISPGGAFFRSLAIPGWAQVELGSEVRGAVYFLAWSTSLVLWARTQQRLDHARRTLGEDDPLVESRTDQREDWIALTIFWALFAGADGWVTSHLYGFEDVTTRPGEVSFQVGWRIPFGP